ncbi:MAG: outer membrane lipoprotein-sorting protein [Acidobacteria bacterium]|nr:outer membrane lipoprotein-sorting protein [Acidobacteriota bacterium]
MKRLTKCALLSLSFTFLPAALVSQEQAAPSVSRDPQAVAVVAHALQAMGGAAPTDLTASGKIELVEGSKKETGTIRLKARGPDQLSEEVMTSDSQRSVVLSKGRGLEKAGEKQSRVSLQLSLSSEATSLPVISLSAALTNPDTAFEYLGVENLGGINTHHIGYWNTYASNPNRAILAEFSIKDVWIDSSTLLPVRLAYDRRAAGGAADRIAVEVLFADYRSVSGALIPFAIAKSFNGTPWATIVFESVAVNTGLSESDFPVQ